MAVYLTKIKDYIVRHKLVFGTSVSIVMFLTVFVIQNILLREEPENSFRIFYTLPLLLGLSCLGCFIFKLSNGSFNKHLYHFLGFVVLLFTVVYCVSFLGYDIQGVKKAQEFAEESKAAAEKSVKAKEESEEIVRTTTEILNLGNQTRWQMNGGDLKSYNALLLLQKEVKNDALRGILTEQINSVNSSYNADDLWRAADSLPYICQYSLSGELPCVRGLEPVEGFNAVNIYQHLTELYKLWPEHARAASLVRKIETSPNKDDVIPSDINKELVRLMQDENEKMMVRKIAFETYKYLNQFHPKSDGIFDFYTAIEDCKTKGHCL